jgi:hypothetical protein
MQICSSRSVFALSLLRKRDMQKRLLGVYQRRGVGMRGEGKERGQAKYRKRHIVHRHPSAVLAPLPLTALSTSQASQDPIDVTAVLIVVAMAMAMAMTMVVFVVVVPRIDKTCGDVQ